MFYIDASGTITFYDLSGSDMSGCNSCSCQMFHHFYCDCSCNGRTCCDCSGSTTPMSLDCSYNMSARGGTVVSMNPDMEQYDTSVAPYLSEDLPVMWSYRPGRADVSGVRRLLLVDSRVRGYIYFLGCLLPNVDYVVATYNRDTMFSILRWIGIYRTQFESIGYISNELKDFYFSFLWKEESAILKLVQQIDASMNSWKPFSKFISDASGICGMKYFDFMGDKIYSHPYWQYALNGLQEQTGVTMRASTDITGNPDVSGNWILEHGNVNAKDLYFTDRVLLYPFSLNR
jgi:hypothetical protein